jgi:hypothetical protein
MLVIPENKCHGEHKNKSVKIACMNAHFWSLQHGQFIGLALVGNDIVFRLIIEYNSLGIWPLGNRSIFI